MLRIATLGLVAAFAGGIANAQNDNRSAPIAVQAAPDLSAALKGAERDFAENVTRIGIEAGAISKVAVERSLNPRVKVLAEKIRTEHGKISAELVVLAAAKGVALPAKDEAAADKWTKRDASDFDVDYVKKVVADHEEAVKLFQKQAREGTDSALTAFARKHLSAMEHHLEQALDLQKTMK